MAHCTRTVYPPSGGITLPVYCENSQIDLTSQKNCAIQTAVLLAFVLCELKSRFQVIKYRTGWKSHMLTHCELL